MVFGILQNQSPVFTSGNVGSMLRTRREREREEFTPRG
jgi:hypothetical protein